MRVEKREVSVKRKRVPVRTKRMSVSTVKASVKTKKMRVSAVPSGRRFFYSSERMQELEAENKI